MHSLATRVIDESRGAERKRKEENKKTNAVKDKSKEGKWQTDRKRKCLTPPQLCLGKTGCESQTRCSQLPAGQDWTGQSRERAEGQRSRARTVGQSVWTRRKAVAAAARPEHCRCDTLCVRGCLQNLVTGSGGSGYRLPLAAALVASPACSAPLWHALARRAILGLPASNRLPRCGEGSLNHPKGP